MAALDPNDWKAAVTTNPPAFDATNTHTYEFARNTRVLGIEVKDATTDTDPLDSSEVEVWGYVDATSDAAWIGRALVTGSRGPFFTRFMPEISYEYIYIRQSEAYTSQGAAGAANTAFDYRVILDTKE
jgi:hypothetical protein